VRNQTFLISIIEDLYSGILKYPIWISLAHQEIKQRYRRSLLGPIWITINLGITLLAIGPLYAIIFNQSIPSYFPQLAVGYILWAYISSTLTDSCNAFKSMDKFIKQIKLPYSLYIYLVIYKNNILLIHYLFLLIPIFILYIELNYYALLSLAGFILVIINLIPLCLILSISCSRYADIAQLVSSTLQLSFFITPILWPPKLLGNFLYLQNFNFFYHMIEVIRYPLLGTLPPIFSVCFLFISSILLSISAIFIFYKTRNSISYWF